MKKDVEPTQLDIEIEKYISTDTVTELESHDSSSWRVQFKTPDHVIVVSRNNSVEIY